VLLEGIKLSREIASARPFAQLLGTPFAPSSEAKSDAELKQVIRQTVSTIYHPSGSCKMGTDRMAVVDPQLRVHGIEGVRVADASIMPTLVNGNTNAPCVMIGEKAAQLIKAV
jgi:choline dehydrogenase